MPVASSAVLGMANFATSCVATPIFGLLADVKGRQWTTMLSVRVVAPVSGSRHRSCSGRCGVGADVRIGRRCSESVLASMCDLGKREGH